MHEVLDKGDLAVATARKSETLKFNGTSDRASLISPLSNSQNYLPIKLNVTDEEQVNAAFKVAADKFGRIDVVVNNAG